MITEKHCCGNFFDVKITAVFLLSAARRAGNENNKKK